jgi:hypothetical protein
LTKQHHFIRASSLAIAILFFFLTFPVAARSAADPKDTAEILNAAESAFQSMAEKDFLALWCVLTAETQRNIIRSVQKAEGRIGHEYTEDQLRADFEKGNGIALDYWGGYLSQFDPKTILKESRWSMGPVNKDRAEIILRHQKSDHDALLKMFREGGIWKVGLDETFSTRQ